MRFAAATAQLLHRNENYESASLSRASDALRSGRSPGQLYMPVIALHGIMEHMR